MQEKLNKLIEISGFLRQTEIGEKLLNMKNALEKGECILAVMGQFSAGKSYLINNIIGKTILPVHITETTAAITLIRYGVKEYALLRLPLSNLSIFGRVEIIMTNCNRLQT